MSSGRCGCGTSSFEECAVSRIDEALRRAGASGAAAPDEQVFVSAWESDGHAALHETHAAPQHRSAGMARRHGESERVTGFSHEQVVTLNPSSRERLALADGDPTLVEQFRRLAATLHHAQATSKIKVIMMTSASP